MLLKIVTCLPYIVLFGLFHSICRMSASYLPRNKCQKYIIIKNDILAIILIAERPSRDKIVGYRDLNKMSIVGLISYITFEPILLYILIICIMHIFKVGNINLGSITNTIVYGVALIIGFIISIASAIDKSQ